MGQGLDVDEQEEVGGTTEGGGGALLPDRQLVQ